MAPTLQRGARRSLALDILRFALPFLLTAELQLLFNTVDLVVIGQFAGSMALAAVGATTTLVNLVVNAMVNFTVGATVSVANHVGAHNDEGIRRTTHTAFTVGLAAGAVLAVVFVAGAEGLLRLMKTPDEILDQSVLYFRIYGLGLPAISVYNFGAAVCRGAGDSKRPLYILTASGVLNAALNLILVICFRWDVAGVAAATSISNYAAAIAMTVFLCHAKDARRLSVRHLGVHRQTLRRICRLGFPALAQSCLFNIANIAVQASVNTLGAAVVAGNSACSSVENFAYTGTSAIGQSAVTFIGQQIGAHEHRRIGRTVLCCLAYVWAFSWLLAGLCYLFGQPLLRLYITDNPAAMTAALGRLHFMLWTFFMCATMDTLTNSLRGMGSSKTPMFITLFGVCIVRFLWIAFIFPRHHTLVGLYCVYPVTYSIAIACQIVAFVVLKRRLCGHIDREHALWLAECASD